MQAQELLSILVKLSKIDDYFDEFELSYLLKAGSHLGIEDSQVEYLVKNPLDVPFVPPQKEQDRMEIIYYMLFLMKIDNIISDQEVDMVHHYGFKLGFSKHMIDDFVQIMKKHKHKTVPTSLMLDVIRKYQN